MHGAMFWQQHASYAGAITTTKQCAEVARVCHTIDSHKEWCHAITWAQQCSKICFFKRRSMKTAP